MTIMFDVLQIIGGIILAVGYIPQIRQVVRTHSCKDLNLKTYAAILSGIICMEAYAINLVLNGSGLMFLITNSLSLLMTLSLCIAILFVSKAKSKRSKESQEDDCFFDSDREPSQAIGAVRGDPGEGEIPMTC